MIGVEFISSESNISPLEFILIPFTIAGETDPVIFVLKPGDRGDVGSGVVEGETMMYLRDGRGNCVSLDDIFPSAIKGEREGIIKGEIDGLADGDRSPYGWYKV